MIKYTVEKKELIIPNSLGNFVSETSSGDYDQGYADGKADGIAEQKGKLKTLNVIMNGTYEDADGYNKVNVSTIVPKIQDERTIDITENGTFEISADDTPRSVAMKKVKATVNVPQTVEMSNTGKAIILKRYASLNCSNFLSLGEFGLLEMSVDGWDEEFDFAYGEGSDGGTPTTYLQYSASNKRWEMKANGNGEVLYVDLADMPEGFMTSRHKIMVDFDNPTGTYLEVNPHIVFTNAYGETYSTSLGNTRVRFFITKINNRGSMNAIYDYIRISNGYVLEHQIGVDENSNIVDFYDSTNTITTTGTVKIL